MSSAYLHGERHAATDAGRDGDLVLRPARTLDHDGLQERVAVSAMVRNFKGGSRVSGWLRAWPALIPGGQVTCIICGAGGSGNLVSILGWGGGLA